MAETIKGVKVVVKVDNKQAQAGFKKTESSLKSLSKSAIGLGAAFLSFRAIGSIVSSTTAAFIEQERVVAQLDASLKSTGNQIGITSGEFRAMAASLQKVTTFGDEQIISAQSMLLTFTKIGKDVFPEVIERTLDLSAKMGQDLKSSVVQLGKALNDPVANLGALSRTGIQFTKDQKAMIKGLWEAGKAAEAQAIILEELNTQFGGSAQAEAETYGGKLKQIGNELGDIGETVGSILVPVMVSLGEALLTALDPLRSLNKEYDILRGKLLASQDASKKRNAEFLKFSKSERESFNTIRIAVEKRYDKETELLKKRMKMAVKNFNLEKAESIKSKLITREKERLNNILQHSHDLLNKQLGKNIDTKKKLNKETKVLTESEKIAIEKKKILEERYKKNNTVRAKALKQLKDEEKAKTKLQETETDSIEIKKQLADEISRGTDGYKDLSPEIVEVDKKINDLIITEALLIAKTKKTAKETKNLEDAWNELGDAFGKITQLGDSLSNFFGSIGLETASQGFNDLTESANAFAGMAKDIASGNVIGAISGAFNYLSDAISRSEAAFESMRDQFSDELTEAVNETMAAQGLATDITYEQIKALEELGKELGNTHVAFSTMMNEMLKGNLTLENSNQWIFRIRETLSDLDRGFLDTAETSKIMGESFSTWLEQAEKLGTVGSQELFDFLGDLKTRGIEIASVNDFIMKMIKEGHEEYKQYLIGDFADTTNETYQSLLEKIRKVAKESGNLNNNIIGSKSPIVEAAINNKVPGFAGGTNGFITPPEVSMVGEQGPELMKFKNGKMNITPNNQASKSGDVIVNIYPERGDNETELMNKVVRGYRNNVSNAKVELNKD